LAKRKTGLAAKGRNLIIDINQDGKANNRDLTIKNFFANNKANKAGKGFIETVDNVSGNKVIQALGKNKVQPRSNNIEDTLIGGSDTLPGNETDDILTNATDGETSQSGIDNAIADFIAGDADKIYLPEDQFPKLDPETDLAEQFAAVASDKAAATSDAYIVYNSNNGNLFYNANGNKPGLGSGGQFATLDGAPELDASDFIV
jgi:Ca2+-binding RTX toxin-like protein